MDLQVLGVHLDAVVGWKWPRLRLDPGRRDTLWAFPGLGKWPLACSEWGHTPFEGASSWSGATQWYNLVIRCSDGISGYTWLLPAVNVTGQVQSGHSSPCTSNLNECCNALDVGCSWVWSRSSNNGAGYCCCYSVAICCCFCIYFYLFFVFSTQLLVFL